MSTVKKRTQKDYSLAFKLSVVEQVEKGELTYKQAQKRYGIQGRSTVLVWLRKHGVLDWSNPHPSHNHRAYLMPPPHPLTPEQRIKELEKTLAEMTQKAEFFESFVKVMEEDFGLKVTKKSLARLKHKGPRK